jgi:hypothetical protein
MNDMRKILIAALIASAASGAALAQSASPGLEQLARIAGVSPNGFTQAQLFRLIKAQDEGDRDEIDFILSQRDGSVGRAELAGEAGTSLGKAQLAAALGVDPQDYTLSELTGLLGEASATDE